MKRSLILKIVSVVFIILIGVSFVFDGKIYPLYNDSKDSDDYVLRLAHNQSTTHPVGVTLDDMAKEITEEDNNLEMVVYPNGQFGSEENTIEQVQMGAIDMTKVSAAALESFIPEYKVFSLPYVFTSAEQYQNAMNNSELVQEIYNSSEDQGFIALTWFEAGQRSIYCTEDEALESPEDLAGKKVRSQSSQTSIDTINAMGASATPMSFSEVYTGLQQGTIDCAENNETALTENSHGEVAKGYTYTEHQYVPDVLIISTKTIDKLTDEQFQSIKDIALEETELHEERWTTAVNEAIEKSENLEKPVSFYRIDKTPFIEATQEMRDEFAAESDFNAQLIEDFDSYEVDDTTSEVNE